MSLAGTRTRAATVALAAVLLLAGCGSSALSPAQFRQSASAACAAATGQTSRIATPTTPAGAEPFLRRGVAVLAPALTRLRALHPPDDLAGPYHAAITAFAGQIRAIQMAVHQLHARGDPVIAMKTLQHRLGPLERAENTAWAQLQIPACLSH